MITKEKLDKILHQFNSGRRKKGGFKLVGNLACEYRKIEPLESLDCLYLVIIWFLVGYRQKNGNYLFSKVKNIPEYYKDKVKAKRSFDFLNKYIKSVKSEFFNLELLKEGDERMYNIGNK